MSVSLPLCAYKSPTPRSVTRVSITRGGMATALAPPVSAPRPHVGYDCADRAASDRDSVGEVDHLLDVAAAQARPAILLRQQRVGAAEHVAAGCEVHQIDRAGAAPEPQRAAVDHRHVIGTVVR